MSVVPGLTIIVASADRGRFRAALEVAAANAALGRPTRLFLQSEAVRLLNGDPHDEAAEGPGGGEMLREAIALGAAVTACQSGLALAGLSAESLPAGVDTGGLVGLLAGRPDDQLLMA